MELIYRQNITLSTEYAQITPAMILSLAQQAAEAHCRELGCDWDTMAKKGLFWAVLRHRIQITRLPSPGETVTVETWPMPTTRTCYPRSMAAFDKTGAPLFQTHSLWVLMDRQTRAMVLPGSSGVDVPGVLRGTELPAPRSLPPTDMEHRRERRVSQDDLDRNGHMNNVRYLDYLAALPDSRLQSAKSLSLCYVNEARLGTALTLSWTQKEDKTLRVEITEEGQNKRIFGALVEF